MFLNWYGMNELWYLFPACAQLGCSWNFASSILKIWIVRFIWSKLALKGRLSSSGDKWHYWPSVITFVCNVCYFFNIYFLPHAVWCKILARVNFRILQTCLLHFSWRSLPSSYVFWKCAIFLSPRKKAFHFWSWAFICVLISWRIFFQEQTLL